MHAQQRLSGRNFTILVLPTNKLKDVLALGDRIAEIVDGASIGASDCVRPRNPTPQWSDCCWLKCRRARSSICARSARGVTRP
jgi:hypothetical protein